MPKNPLANGTRSTGVSTGTCDNSDASSGSHGTRGGATTTGCQPYFGKYRTSLSMRYTATAPDGERAYLVQAGREVASLLKDDYDRLTAILRRIRP